MRRRVLLLTLGFALLLAVGLARHEMWRDELQAWMLVRASPTLPALLANMRFEGHPPLWHLLLFPLARATARPEAMQALHWAIATLGAGLFLAWAPLPLRWRALFVCGYLPLFEYGEISRNYALALPLLWAICRLWPRQGPRRWPWLGLALALLANANPYGWLLAAALLATLAIEAAATAEGRSRLLAALAGLAFALWRMLPPTDALYAGGFYRWWAPRAYRTLGTVLAGYLPFPDWRTVTPWNSALVNRLPPPLLALAGVLWLVVAFVLLGSRPARTLFVLGTGALLVFTYSEYIGWARHHGHHFLLFVACCWLASLGDDGAGWRSRARAATLVALLVVHAATAARFYAAGMVHPFSDAKLAAARLDAPPLAGLVAVGYPDPVLTAVGAYRGRLLLSLASGRAVDFIRWREGGDPQLTPPAVCASLAAAVQSAGGPLAFVAPPAALPAACPGVHAERVGPAPLPLVPSERLATWRVTQP